MSRATYRITEIKNISEVESTLKYITNFKELMKIDLPSSEDKIVVLRRLLHEVYSKINELEKRVEELEKRK